MQQNTEESHSYCLLGLSRLSNMAIKTAVCWKYPETTERRDAMKSWLQLYVKNVQSIERRVAARPKAKFIPGDTVLLWIFLFDEQSRLTEARRLCW